jgi:hypothetical protein
MNKYTHCFFSLCVLFLPIAKILALSDAEQAEKILTLEKKVEQLEAKNTKLEKHVSRRNSSLNDKMDRYAERIKFEGFLSFGASTTDEENYGYSDKVEYRSKAIVGLQTHYRLSEKTQAVTQIIGQGEKDFDPEFRWAYLAHQYSDAIQARAGRIKTPFYYYSETLDVAFSYPWVSPPGNIYSPELSAFEGFDILYNFAMADTHHRLQFAIGSMKESLGGALINSNTGLLLNVESNIGPFTTRIGATYSPNTNVSVDGLGEHEFPVGFYDFAVVYDAANWFALLEAIQVDVSANDNPALPNEKLFVALFNYRFDRCYVLKQSCSVYISRGENYTTAETDYSDVEFSGIIIPGYHLPFKQSSANLGVRFDLSSKIALKLEVEQSKADEFNANEGGGEKPNEGVNRYNIVFNAVF